MKKFFSWILGIVLLAVLLSYLLDYNYIWKGIRVVYLTGHTTAFIDDFEYFETDTIANAANPKPWPKHKDYNKANVTAALAETNDQLGTIAFLIIKNDSVWFEEYYDGFDANSKTNSFSMAKSIVSVLLGKAVQEGHIESLEQPVADFFPEFDDRLSVGDLSSMASGLNWDESYTNPFGITARAYYDDDLAETMLGLKVTETPGEKFKYLSGNTQLLAMVVQKAVGKPLSDYLSESFWKPMGAANEAIWQVDDADHKLVKAYCCIGSNARDFARFGKLYKDHGNWNGKQLLDSTFVTKSIKPRFEESPQYGYGFWLSDFMEKEIFVMRGILGQYVITIPEDDLIIVRLGHHRGEKIKGSTFSSDFYTYIAETYAMLEKYKLD
ncbi:serine hydrolase domain-containing protein [Luteirhabdus pelagi]|uniref:serine hydrolase domain-containing protein n=1 Tax=Luteirhabdus pelagi TaxID=2792783 RepID=UPI00193A1969|nr:serine hydrolase [Luteirhabdus pelagi]